MRKKSIPNKSRTETKRSVGYTEIKRNQRVAAAAGRLHGAPQRSLPPGGRAPGPCLPRHMGTGVCGHGRQATGTRSLEPLVPGKRPPRSAGPGPRGTRTGKEHVRGRHRPQNRGQRDRLRGTVLVHERQRESLHGSTENRKIKFKISFTLLVCGIVRKESCS